MKAHPRGSAPPIVGLDSGASRDCSGFALVIALSLMAFVLLLLLSISTLVRVEVSAAATGKQQFQARQNALTAAMLALGELQKYAGPDQRITARSDILNPTGTAPTAAGERFWTGVWDVEPEVLKDSDNTTRLLPGQPFKDIKERGVAKWLVSNPTPTVDLDPANYTLTANDSVTLYKDPVPTDVDGNADDQSIEVNLIDIEGAQGQLTGKYAWWVSDEGVKASIGLADQLGTSDEDKEKALLSIQRTAPELLSSGSESLETLPDSSDYSKIADLQHLSLIIDDVVTDGAETQKNLFHDVTVNSVGLPVDVRQGGFKQDLTWILGDDDQFDEFIANENQGDLLFGGVGAYSNQSNPHTYDASIAFDPGGTQIGEASTTGGWGRNLARDPGGPSWEQLRRFYNVSSQIDADGAVVSSADDTREDAYGIYPVLSHYQMHFEMIPQVSGGSAAPNGDNSYQMTPRVFAFPFIRIWNPYNVSLKARNYYFAQSGSGFRVSVDFDGDGDGVIPKDGDNTTYDYVTTKWKANKEVQRDWLNPDSLAKDFKEFRFYVKDLSMGPGESIALSLKESKAFDINEWEDGYELVPLDITNMGVIYQDLPTFTGTIKAGIDEVAFWLNTSELSNGTIVFGTDDGATDAAIVWGGENTVPQPLQYYGRIFNRRGASNPYNPTMVDYAKLGHVPIPFYVASLASGYAQAVSGPADLVEANASTLIDFPSSGYYLHLKTLLNHVSKAENAKAHAKTLPLGMNNPRGSRQGRMRLHKRHDKDSDYNHLYHNNQDHWFEEGRDEYSAYRLMTQFLPTAGDGVVVYGLSDDSDSYSGGTRWMPFELPRDFEYFTSVGSLTHANLQASGMQTFTQWASGGSGLKFSECHLGNNFNPAYPIGNSLNSMFTGTASLFRTHASGNLYDWSYLLNDLLWDRYFFSTYIDTDGGLTLNNPRYRFDESLGEGLLGSGFASEDEVRENYASIGSRIVVDGAFNINSTSVEAWKAFLGGMLGVAVNNATSSDRAPYPRVTTATGDLIDAMETDASLSEEAHYTGYSSLSSEQIDSLARGIVHEVRLRGPFVSLSHFINRSVGGIQEIKDLKWKLPFQVDADGLSIYETEKERQAADDGGFYIYQKGPLQAAIDYAASAKLDGGANLNAKLLEPLDGIDDMTISAEDFSGYDQFMFEQKDIGALYGQTMAHSYNGFINQADLLARIGPVMTPRSDTFKIRSYGDVRNPMTGILQAKAWCELTVRRTARYVDSEDKSFDAGRDTLADDNVKFGRKFEIVAMRWLTEDEI